MLFINIWLHNIVRVRDSLESNELLHTGVTVTVIYRNQPRTRPGTAVRTMIISLIKAKNNPLTYKRGIKLYQACKYFEMYDYTDDILGITVFRLLGREMCTC